MDGSVFVGWTKFWLVAKQREDYKSIGKKKGEVKNSIRKISVELQALPFFSVTRRTQVTDRVSGDVDDSGELPPSALRSGRLDR